MKSSVKFVGFIAILAVIGAFFIGCDDGLSELTGTVTITGTAQVGQHLSANISHTNAGYWGFSYTWNRSGTDESIGSSQWYTVQTSDIGSTITVTVTAPRSFGSITSEPTAMVTGASLPALGGTVSISGTAQVGQIVTADTSSLGGSGTIFYTWYRNGSVIVGSNSTYIIQNEDIGSTITVTVMRSDNSGSFTSEPTIPVTNPALPALTGTVSINGTAQVGQTLTANTSALGGSGTITYQWRQNGTTVIGTNSPTFTVTSAGYTITVTVIRSDNSGSITSTPTSAASDDPSLPALTGSVSINGVNQTGQTLTANTSALNGSGDISYRWRRNGIDVGTNSDSYVLSFTDIGYAITVSVTRFGHSGNVTSAATNAVVSGEDANGLRYVLITNNTAYSVSRGSAIASELVIPAIYNGLPVTTIPENGFVNYSNLTSLEIPESMTNVASGAFDGCINLSITWNYNSPLRAWNFREYLKNVIISDNVTSIGWGAFSGCTGLTSITIPDSVTSIGSNAFQDCLGLTSVIVPDSVTSIDWGAFSGCNNLETITIPFVGDGSVNEDTHSTRLARIFNSSYSYSATNVPSSLKTVIVTGGTIYNSAFSFLTNLTSITIGNNVTGIDRGAFQGCTSLTSVTIGNSVTSIGQNAFSNTGIWNNAPDNSVVYADKWVVGYKGTTSSDLTLNADTIGIASSSFMNYTGLTSITIPNSVTSIGGDAFFGCNNLVSIDVGTNNPNYASQDGILYNKARSQLLMCPPGFSGSITIPNSVTSIGGGAFFGCTGLTSVTIGTITSSNFISDSGGRLTFPGNLRTVYFDAGGGAGTYTTANPGSNAVWVKQ